MQQRRHRENDKKQPGGEKHQSSAAHDPPSQVEERFGGAHDYVDAQQLASATGLSVATIWRLKRAGKIPFYQPGGEHHFVLFPCDANEHVNDHQTTAAAGQKVMDTELKGVAPAPLINVAERQHLSGPQPKWMRSTQIR